MTGSETPSPLADRSGERPARRRFAIWFGRWAVQSSYPVAAGLLCLFALGPLLHPEFLWEATEAPRSVGRLEALVAGAGASLWAGLDGPLAYLIGALVVRAGLAPTDAIKVTLGLGLVASSLATYCLAADLWGQRGGLLAAVLYSYAPVRVVDLYVRGALAESVAWLFPPLALWAGRRALLGSGWQAHGSVLLAVLAIVLLLLTHLGVTVVATPVLLLFWLVVFLTTRREYTPGRARHLAALVLVAGLAASAGMLLLSAAPNSRDPAAYVIYPHQLLSPQWGYGRPAPGPDDPLSLEIGVVPAALTLVAVVLAFWLRENGRPALRLSQRRRATLAYFAVLAACAALLSLPPTVPLWGALPAAATLELPWRLLGVAALGLAVAGGACGLLSSGRPGGQVALATLVGVAVLAVFPYLQASESVFRPPPTPSGSVAPPR